MTVKILKWDPDREDTVSKRYNCVKEVLPFPRWNSLTLVFEGGRGPEIVRLDDNVQRITVDKKVWYEKGAWNV